MKSQKQDSSTKLVYLIHLFSGLIKFTPSDVHGSPSENQYKSNHEDQQRGIFSCFSMYTFK